MQFTNTIIIFVITLFAVCTRGCLVANIRYTNQGWISGTFVDNGVEVCFVGQEKNAFDREVGKDYKAARMACDPQDGIPTIGAIAMSTKPNVPNDKKFYGIYVRKGEFMHFGLDWHDDKWEKIEYRLTAKVWGC